MKPAPMRAPRFVLTFMLLLSSACSQALAQPRRPPEDPKLVAKCQAVLDQIRSFAKGASAGNVALESAILRAAISGFKPEEVSAEGYAPAFPDLRGIEIKPWDRDPEVRRNIRKALEAKGRQCSRPESEGLFRIVGADARKVSPGDHKSTVAIRRNRDAAQGKSWLCTGTIIDKTAVLTAAHCVCDLELTTGGLVDDDKTIFVGENINSDTFRKLRIDPKGVHLLNPAFCKKWLPRRDVSVINGDDLALIRFAPNETEVHISYQEDLSCTTNIKLCMEPARIGTPYVMLADQTTQLTIVGFGLDNFDVAGWKLQTTVLVVSRICGDVSAVAQYGCKPGHETVLVGSGDNDTCAGDSGGPVFAELGQRDGSIRRVLVAVTSRGHSRAVRKCGDGGIYTLITPFIVGWIRSHGVFIKDYWYPSQ